MTLLQLMKQIYQLSESWNTSYSILNLCSMLNTLLKGFFPQSVLNEKMYLENDPTFLFLFTLKIINIIII